MPHWQAIVRAGAAFLISLAGLGACAPTGVFDYPVSSDATERWPDLHPIGAFPLAPDGGDPRVSPLESASADLAARAEALRRRGAALAGVPVLAGAEQDRLAAAVANR